jgi:hypothetical protein
MMASTITILRPNVTREEALRALETRGPLGLPRRLTGGPLRTVADVYVPFRMYRVTITSAGRTEVKILGFDAAFGLLDPFEFPAVPSGRQTSTVETRNAAPSTLDEAAAAQMLTDKVRRLLFLQGFFRLRNLDIHVEALAQTVHFPYWVGFYGSGQAATLRVIDAVRRRPEGAKMRHALRHWLAG